MANSTDNLMRLVAFVLCLLLLGSAYVFIGSSDSSSHEQGTKPVPGGFSSPLDSNYSGPGMPSPIDASPSSAHSPLYSRSLYRHWIDEDKDCQDTRQEVLISESSEPVVLTVNSCAVKSGRWTDPYTGNTYSDPADIDIDHLVPLKEAHESGAWAWTPAKRQAYANDLTLPFALIAVGDGANQSKGARDPASWMPESEEYHCNYALAWIAVKTVYKLQIDEAERLALSNALSKC